jgi:hypothetical protein
VVYKLCFRIISARAGMFEIVRVMEYNTATEHRTAGDVGKIKVP